MIYRKIDMFFGIKKNNKIYNKKLNLHASASYKKNVRRTFLFSYLRRLRHINHKKTYIPASLTLEASLVFPIYIFFLICFIYILNILGLQNRLYFSMDEACRMANKNIYIVQSINSLDDKTKEAYASEKEISLTDISDIALNEAYIKKCFFSDFTTEIINNSSIKNGVDGVNLYNANAFFSSDDIDLNISYTIPIPFLPWNPIEVSINQRLLFRCFTGEDITGKTGSSTKYVYVTAGGDVYHTSPYCSYLSKYYDILSDALFEEALSETDSYTACMYCGDTPNPHGCVFMCPHSKVYHCDINCFNLDTKVYSVPFEDVCDHMPLCSRCKLGVD